MRVALPSLWLVDLRQHGNLIRQLGRPAWTGQADVNPLSGRRRGFLIEATNQQAPTYVLSGPASTPSPDWTHVLRSTGTTIAPNDAIQFDAREARWLSHPNRPALSSLDSFEQQCEMVRRSWDGAFTYKAEDLAHGVRGLRMPQIGAIHAIHAHCTVSEEPATIVLPTGVGKTETMLSLLVTRGCKRLLVVVPSDVLRSQLATKFESFGLLKSLDHGVISATAQYPVVGTMSRRPRTAQETEDFFRKCNVIVTTMALASQCDPAVMQVMAQLCSHLFIDEAHHIAAPTWGAFKQAFADAQIIQFTATPYRNDDRPVEGKRVYTFPLRRAQDQGYFTQINFKPVIEFDPGRKDACIAEAAVQQLRQNFDRGHIVMARTANVARAKQVFEQYRAFAEFHPVQLHTGITSNVERSRIREQIISGRSRIVVCVDMLGEGFDLPELKIAAFHDIRKTLAVTLQLAGRFTRTKPNLGPATFIANIADLDVKHELKRLYQHDSDWNALLPLIGDTTSAGEVSLGEFLGGFESLPDEITLRNVRPAMSTVVYKTRCKEWTPESFADGIAGFDSLDRVYHTLNPLEHTLVVVTARRTSVEWAQIDEIHTWDWQLYVLHWDPEASLLFIHNSSNAGFFRALAEAVAGEVAQVRGPPVFRCLAGIDRIRFQNIGLLVQLGRLVRYEMRAGSDVEPAMSEAQKRRAIKANLFGKGFEAGQRTTIGCSYKGRIWSYKKTNIQQLTRWCRAVGTRLIDESINPEEVLKGTLEPRLSDTRPHVMPIGIEWPDVFYNEPEQVFEFVIDDADVYLHEADLTLVDPQLTGDLAFAIAGGNARALFTLKLGRTDDTPTYSIVGGAGSQIRSHGALRDLREFLEEQPPTIWFADGSSLCGCQHVSLRRQPDPFPTERLESWDWTDTDIRAESQGAQRHPQSIQYRVIQHLRNRGGSVVLFDDDDQGESADIVAIAEGQETIDVEFWHCKYSGGDNPGARIKDLYELCGQAQKSVRWLDKPRDLFTHLLRREPRRRNGNESTRFEVGTKRDLLRIREKTELQRVNLRVAIVQPGLSKAGASNEQRELLAVTEHYLLETFAVPLVVVTSP